MRRLLLTTLSLCLLVLNSCGGSSGGGSPAAPDLRAQIEPIVEPYLCKQSTTQCTQAQVGAYLGAAVLIVRPAPNGGPPRPMIFRYASRTDANGKPVLLNENHREVAFTDDTPLEIGSITKTLTTNILAQLAYGQMSILAETTNLLPPLATVPVWMVPNISPPLTIPTTILDLANYTSGLPDANAPDNGTCDSSTYPCFTLDQMFANLTTPVSDPCVASGQFLGFAPGIQYCYSDLAVAFLSLALPTLDGSTETDPSMLQEQYAQMLQQMVLTPLGMTSSHLFSLADLATLPLGYMTDGTTGHVNGNWPAYLGAGGLVTTPRDMLAYLRFNLGQLDTGLEKILPLMLSPTTAVTTPSGSKPGLGWFIGQTRGAAPITEIYKNGGLPGYSAYIVFSPDTKIGVAVMINSVRTAPKLGSQVFEFLNNLPPGSSLNSDDPG
ncbi:MAG: serine hydrolase domain-containing protein [Candidatus Binataceae bacterium]